MALGTALSQSLDSVVDLGEQGLSEGDLIDPYFEEHFESGVEVRIPAGSYRWNGSGWGQVGNARLIGEGEVELHRPDEMNPRLEAQAGVVEVRNLTVRGAAGNNTSSIRLGAHDPSALLLMENFNLPDGSVDPSFSTGIYVPPAHAGVLVLRDCHVEGFADNGLYASAPGGHTDYTANDGAVVVDGGLYKNNNISNVRIGSSNSIVQNATIVHDGPAPTAANGADLRRGLRVRQAGENLRVVNCDIVQRTPRWAVSFHDGASGGSGVIERTRIQHDGSDPAIRAQDGFSGDWVARNVHITGDGDLGSMIPLENSCQGAECRVPDASTYEPLQDGSELTFVGTESRSYEYAVTTTGRITPRYEDDDRPATPGSHDYAYENDDGTWTAKGSVATGTTSGDSLVFDGSVQSVAVSGDQQDVTVHLDGEAMSIEQLLGSGSGDGSDGTDGSGSDGTDSTDGTDDTDGTDGTDSTEGTDGTDGTDGSDSTDGTDGRDGTDGSDGSGGSDLANTITVDGTDSSEVTTYRFTVTGDVARADVASSETAEGAPTDRIDDLVSGSEVIGVVVEGVDAYHYSGTVESIDVDGDATVTFE